MLEQTLMCRMVWLEAGKREQVGTELELVRLQQTRPCMGARGSKDSVMDCWAKVEARWSKPETVGHKQERLAGRSYQA